MVEINLFQPGKVDAVLQFPQEWNELHVQELSAISKNFLTEFKQKYDGKVSIFLDMLLFRSRHHKASLPKDFQLNLNEDDTLINGLPLVDFIYEGNTLTKNPYPYILNSQFPIVHCKLYGPADEFNDLTCGEFEDAEIFFHQFVDEPQQESLARLAAILWRPRSFSNLWERARVRYITYHFRSGRYTSYNADKHYKFFLKQPQWMLHTIFMWYAGCRMLLPQFFPTIHETSGSKDEDLSAFTKCIHAGAGPKNGSRDQIRCTLLKEFFYEMELEAVKAKEQLEEMQKLRRR